MKLVEERHEWAHKSQFVASVLSFAVGLGNVWRFPYLLVKNGGGAFLIPYCIMMCILGMPIFMLEMALGQFYRTGSVGVWKKVHPAFAGVGIASAVVSFIVAIYYNVIVAWCFYYLIQSITSAELPWTTCPPSGPYVWECGNSSSVPQFFFNRMALDTTSEVSEFGGFNKALLTCFVISWLFVYFSVGRGQKSTGNVMYFTCAFPLVVILVFLFHSLSLEGAFGGIRTMFRPEMGKLFDGEVWMDAASQTFYSVGCGFGGLTALGSYNKKRNNFRKDAVLLSIVNVIISLITAMLIFAVLGYMATSELADCTSKLHSINNAGDVISNNQTVSALLLNDHVVSVAHECNFRSIIIQSAEGTGLAFVVFTEAILTFPWPSVFAFIFFAMLLTLGLGSMIGTLQSVITSVRDSRFINASDPVITLFICGSACLVGLPFACRNGQYLVALFDQFAAKYGLICVVLSQLIAVNFGYGLPKFCADVKSMTGEYPSAYWRFSWRYASLAVMGFMCISAAISSMIVRPEYSAYDPISTKQFPAFYPFWTKCIAVLLIFTSIAPVPIMVLLYLFKAKNLKCLDMNELTDQVTSETEEAIFSIVP